MRATTFHQKAWEELVEWSRRDKKLFERLVDLIEEIKRTPFTGKGKPEPLKGNLKGCWSRRLSDEHRIVYQVNDETIIFLSCRGHYQ